MKVVYVPLTIPALYRVLFAVAAMLAATVCVWTVTLTNSPVYKQRVDVELRGHTSSPPTAGGGAPSPEVGGGANYSTTMPPPALLFQSAASSRYVATTTFVSYDGVVRVECISTQDPDAPTTPSPLTTTPAPPASTDEDTGAAQNSTAAPLLLGPFCTVETATHKQLWFAGLVAAAAPGVAGIVALIAVFIDDRTLGPTGSVATGLEAVAIWFAHRAVLTADMRGVADRVLARYGGAGSLRVFDEQYTGYLVVRWVVLVAYAACALVGFTACCTKVQRPLVLRATRNRGGDDDERGSGAIPATDDAEMMDTNGVSYDMSSRTLRPAVLPQMASGDRGPTGPPDAVAATQRPSYTLSVPKIRLLGTESHTAAAVAVAHSAAAVGPEDDDDAASQYSPRQAPPPHHQRLTPGEPRAAEPVVDYNVADDGSSGSAAAAPPTPPPA